MKPTLSVGCRSSSLMCTICVMVVHSWYSQPRSGRGNSFDSLDHLVVRARVVLERVDLLLEFAHQGVHAVHVARSDAGRHGVGDDPDLVAERLHGNKLEVVDRRLQTLYLVFCRLEGGLEVETVGHEHRIQSLVNDADLIEVVVATVLLRSLRVKRVRSLEQKLLVGNELRINLRQATPNQKGDRTFAIAIHHREKVFLHAYRVAHAERARRFEMV